MNKRGFCLDFIYVYLGKRETKWFQNFLITAI